MSENEFLCVALFTAKENQEIKLTEELNQLVAKTIEEPGCVSYELFTSNQDPRKVLVHEIYKSEDDFKTHSQSNHLQELMKLVPELVEHVHVKTA
jgi:quinol monooxygenase YgiN